MYVRRLEESPRQHRGGQTSYLLLSSGDAGNRNLSITWIEGGSGSEQAQHSHSQSEQAYVIVEGRGLMRVAGEEQEVSAGTFVFVPIGASHSIRNIGEGRLVCITATSPPFDVASVETLTGSTYQPPSKDVAGSAPA
jgi:mannose-6-phosphate isomerase-like protein (cupin superfamily)